MLPLNEYQTNVYKLLHKGVQKAKVYDDVPKNVKLPIVILGDYTIGEGLTKKDSYIIRQNIDIYSEYEGKKEINTIITQVVNAISPIFNTDLNKEWCCIGIRLLDSEVARTEDIYVANLKFEIEIEEEN